MMKDDNKTELEKRIDNEIISYRKNGNNTLLSTAQLIKAALVNNKHSDSGVSEIEILQRMMKERNKSIAAYVKANRDDLAQKEADEITYIKEFLPDTSLINEQVHSLISRLCKTNSLTIKDTKKVIEEVLGQYPMAEKSEIVKIFKSFL